MQRRKLLHTPALAASALLASAALAPTAQAQTAASGAAPRHKVVFQMSEGDQAKWNLLLNNARNVQQDLGAAQVDIEIVAYGPGIGMLTLDSAANSRISDALKAGIKVVACENTMHAQKLSRDDMHPGIGYAQAGVVEIMRLQQAGWSYIRP